MVCVLQNALKKKQIGQLRKKFKERLLANIRKIATAINKDQPEHQFLIGLAYLEGIDMEMDRQRGMDMITTVAEAELSEAMDFLYRVYANGLYTDDDEPSEDNEKAFQWAKRRVDHYTSVYGEEDPVAVWALCDLILEYGRIINWSSGSGST